MKATVKMKEIIISQKAMHTFENLPDDIRQKMSLALEQLQQDDNHLDKVKLPGSDRLIVTKVSNKYRIIYSQNNDTINIVDYIDKNKLSGVMKR